MNFISTLNSHTAYIILVSIFLGCLNNGGQGATKQSLADKNGPAGLQIKIVTEGKGVEATAGDTVFILETMSYADGRILFSTDQLGHAIQFIIGAGQAIDGIDQGVRGMKVGEIRELIVPPEMSHRSEYPSFLSPDSTLYYVIQLISVGNSEIQN